MNWRLWHKFNRIHMVGILGSGMSGLAEIFKSFNFQITGSDMSENETALKLRSLGIDVHIGHNADLVNDANVVVYSTAVRPDNAEIIRAKQLRIPVIPRAEMLAELMRMKAGIAIAGTHGKSTTTALTGEALSLANIDPTVITGGRLRRLGGSVIQGQSEFLVAEADEFDKSFLRLTPTFVVLLNIDSDHLECYGTFAELENAFVKFANSVPFYGKAILCIDDHTIQRIYPRITRAVTTYGFLPQADIRIYDPIYNQMSTKFKINAFGKDYDEIYLSLPGRHNVLNATAALAVGFELGADLDLMKQALIQFQGLHRRFEIYGEKSGIMVVDDFAHHPAEIDATLSAARNGWNRRIVAVFQPHLFSRTLELHEQFGRALLGADVACVLPIYPAREQPIEGVTSNLIFESAQKLGHKNLHQLDDKSQVIKWIKSVVREGDMLLILGAGDVYRIADQVMEQL